MSFSQKTRIFCVAEERARLRWERKGVFLCVDWDRHGTGCLQGKVAPRPLWSPRGSGPESLAGGQGHLRAGLQKAFR